MKLTGGTPDSSDAWAFYSLDFAREVYNGWDRTYCEMTDHVQFSRTQPVGFLGKHMIKFEQISEIAQHQQSLTKLQRQMNAVKDFGRIGYVDEGGGFHDLPENMHPFLKETVGKWYALEALKILTECRRLSVDTSDGEAAIKEFLVSLRPPPATPVEPVEEPQAEIPIVQVPGEPT